MMYAFVVSQVAFVLSLFVPHFFFFGASEGLGFLTVAFSGYVLHYENTPIQI